MKRELKTPPKPTKEEAEKLRNFMWMADWHFEETIKRKCTKIECYYIYNTSEDAQPALVYGLEAMNSETKEPCIANLFIRYSYRVYQMRTLSSVTQMIDLLRKEEKYKEYEDKLSDQQYKERKKLLAKKKKEKGMVRKLKVAKTKAA